ncbi:MAG: hypothetical protein GVX78_04645 [Bacteroidetes bacterium]|jgi:hypothetical protein|nr:hypothetical protein [Bacteroidota bacterium]
MVENLLRIANNFLRIVKVTLTTGWISILIIAIIVLLLTQMEQGSALLVSLLDSPVNMFLFMALIIGLLLVIGHYPIYLMMWRRDHSVYRTLEAHQQPVSWNLKEVFGGMGYVSFIEKDEKRSNTFLFRQVNYMRGVLGITFILCLSVILNHAVKTYIFPDFPNFMVSGIIFVIFLFLHTALNYYQYRILAFPTTYAFLHRSVFFFFWAATIAAIAAVMSSILLPNGWNPYTFMFFILHWVCVGFLYCLFKNFRSELRFIPYLWPLNLLGRHLAFIKFNSALGLFAFLIFMSSQFTTQIHPLVILLSFLHLIYGIFIVIIKHRFYYISSVKNAKNKLTRLFFLYGTPVIFPFILLLFLVSGNVGNDLHLLKGIKKDKVISIEEFKEQFYTHTDSLQTSDSTLYFISSYGGGLKANAWNLFVLDTLSNFQGQNILDQTVAMSGVSGGALGQHFYTSLERQGIKSKQKKNIISAIARSNMLSLDFAWLLGFDLVREAIPFISFHSPDRAAKAMEIYIDVLGDPDMKTRAYQSYWADLFKQSYYPIQIANSAGTHQKRGISCSVSFQDFSNVFPNADNLCDLSGNTSLSFADAVSISHRFPVFSPAAKIESKGHYVDGGYFENSGMLSLLDLFLYLQQDSDWNEHFEDWDMAFIQIRNDKNAFLRSKLNLNSIEIAETQESKELTAILKGLNSIRHLPMYIEEKMISLSNPSIRYSAIDLPYRITKRGVREVLHARKLSKSSDSLINKIIRDTDREINHALSYHPNPDWGTIEPPLARYLSAPAVNYMEIMLKHDHHLFENFQSCRRSDKK